MSLESSTMRGNAGSPNNESFFGWSNAAWFWIILVVGMIAMVPISGIESDLYLGAGTLGVVVIGSALLRYAANFNVLVYLKQNWRRMIGFFAIFMVLGAIHSVFRWELHLRDWRAEYDKAQVAFLQKRNLDTKAVPAELANEWKQRYELLALVGPKPQYLSHESTLKRWIILWPWSLSNWLLSDFVTELLTTIYNSLGTIYDWQSKRYTGDVK